MTTADNGKTVPEYMWNSALASLAELGRRIEKKDRQIVSLEGDAEAFLDAHSDACELLRGVVAGYDLHMEEFDCGTTAEALTEAVEAARTYLHVGDAKKIVGELKAKNRKVRK